MVWIFVGNNGIKGVVVMKFLQFENNTLYEEPQYLFPYLGLCIHFAMIKSFSSLCNESVVCPIICRELLSISKKKVSFRASHSAYSDILVVILFGFCFVHTMLMNGMRRRERDRILQNGITSFCFSFQTNKNDDVVDGFFLAKPFFPSKEKTHTNVVDRIAVLSSKKYMVDSCGTHAFFLRSRRRRATCKKHPFLFRLVCVCIYMLLLLQNNAGKRHQQEAYRHH